MIYRNFIKYFAFFYLLFIPLQVVASELCQTPWRVAVSDRYPFEVFIEGKPKGLNIDMISKVASKFNCMIEFQDLPFARIIYEAKQGNLDIVMGVGKRKEREAFAYFFEPYLNSPSVIVVFKENLKHFSHFKLSDVAAENYKFKIAGMIGAVYNKEYEKFLSNQTFVNHLILTSKNSISLKKLLHKEVDAILLSDIAIAKSLINSSGNENDLQMIPIDKEDFSYFMYSKKTFTEQQARKINSYLVTLLKEKDTENLMLKYFTKEELKIFK